MKLTGRLDHDPNLGETALKRLVVGRLAQIEQLLEGVGFMVVDDPVTAGERTNKDGSKRWARGGRSGQADIRLVVLSQAWGVEMKTKKGKQSKKQREYQRRLELAGGRYILARNLRQALEPVCRALGIEIA